MALNRFKLTFYFGRSMKNCFPILLFLLVFVTALHAQPSEYTNRKNASAKQIRALDRVTLFLRSDQLEKALTELDKLLEEDATFIDAHLKKAEVLYDLNRVEEAEESFEKALTIDPAYRKIASYQLAITEMRQRKFLEAAEHFQQYLDSGAGNQRQLDKAHLYLEQAKFSAVAYENPVDFAPQRLPDAINSEGQEYLPSLTADESTLVFTKVVNNQEDFYVSRKIDGVWQPAQAMKSINTSANEGAQTISADGKMILFTACNRPDGLGRCDLYYSLFRNGEWTKAANVGEPINSAAWDSQPSLSADGKSIYFTSNRGGTLGGKDIWVTHRKPNGFWSRPENLGDSINTKGDDKGPFIHPDGKTLYFMSNGHPGLGGFDLYYSRKDESGAWSTPVNLGFPINTARDEGLLVISLDGKTAYFSSDRDDLDMGAEKKEHLVPNYDIFTFELYPEARPEPVTYLKALVRDAVSGAALPAKVELVALEKEEVVLSGKADAAGSVLTVLPAGQDYAL